MLNLTMTTRESVGLFLSGVVSFDGLGLDDDGGVAALVVLTLGGDGAGDVAGRESERNGEAGQEGCHCRRNDFVDLLFGHNIEIYD